MRRLRCGPLPEGFLDESKFASTIVTDRNGVVLYDGETSVPFGEDLYAVPVRFLWE